MNDAVPPIDLASYREELKGASPPAPFGRVREMVGMLVEVEGLTANVGSQLEVCLPNRRLTLEVLGFRDGRLLAAPLGATVGVAPGARVRRSPHAAATPVGEAMLGRILDAFCVPLDGKPPPNCRDRVPLYAPPPPPFSRRPISTPIETGVRMIDALLPLGQGQRIGLFAGTGVGKSTLLGMMCRHSQADVIVVGLIGERGREVGDFVRGALAGALHRSIVVAATSDTPPLVRVRGALLTTAIAEHFRAQGKRVLLVMDSVTRYAMALREASLAAGEPPLTKGYTPSVFAALPSLLERAGTSEGAGSITAVYTVLVEGDDLNDPIADAVRGILDGHIVLSRKIADRGLFPAIDPLRSISRLMHDVSTKEHVDLVAQARSLLSAYAEAADLIQIGAYVPGSDPRVDAARANMPKLEALQRQSLEQGASREEALRALRAAVEVSR